MRLSWGQGLVAGFVLAVTAGMLVLPSRVLTPVRDARVPINLPQAVSPAVVLVAPATPARAVHHRRPPNPARPAVTRPVPAKLPAADVAPKPTPRASRPAPVPPLDATLGRARHLPLPPDEAPPPAAPPAAPAPAPTPAPAPAPAPPATPAPPHTPATVAATSSPPSDCPPASRSGNGHEQDHDHTPNGKACGYDK